MNKLLKHREIDLESYEEEYTFYLGSDEQINKHIEEYAKLSGKKAKRKGDGEYHVTTHLKKFIFEIYDFISL